MSGAGPARRAYDARQLRCLSAMGLTPWVAVRPVRTVLGPGARTAPEAVAAPDMPAVPEVPDIPEVPAAPDVPAIAPPPESPAAAASTAAPSRPDPHVLLDRPVAAFVRRGATVLETGDASARVLIFVDRDPASADPAASPLEGDAAALLQLMLRSIELERGDVSLCLPAPTPESAGATVGELLGRTRRTVLWLVHDPEASGALEPDAALRAAGTAAWRLPHPALLLERPALKREAWRTLKAVRRRLGELPA